MYALSVTLGPPVSSPRPRGAAVMGADQISNPVTAQLLRGVKKSPLRSHVLEPSILFWVVFLYHQHPPPRPAHPTECGGLTRNAGHATSVQG